MRGLMLAKVGLHYYLCRIELRITAALSMPVFRLAE